MNLEELRDKLSYVLNFNPNVADQGGFTGTTAQPNKRIDQLLNEAGREEFMQGRTNGSLEAFVYEAPSFTWTANAETMPVPAYLKGKEILEFLDDTNSDREPIYRSQNQWEMEGLAFVDPVTLRWEPAPSSARTIVPRYLAGWVDLVSPGDVPSDVMAPDHHDLLVWSAACLAYDLGDKQAPAAWIKRRDNLRFLWHKALSAGRIRRWPGQVMFESNDYG